MVDGTYIADYMIRRRSANVIDRFNQRTFRRVLRIGRGRRSAVRGRRRPGIRLFRSGRGGGNGDEAIREVVQYGDTPGMFIDKEGYNGGDAKLVYTLVSYEYSTGNFFYGVKITDMEKDLRSTSYTVFPDQVKFGETIYLVVGNFVTKNTSDGTFTDAVAEGEFKLSYTAPSGYYVSVSGYTYDGEAIPLILPDRITLVGDDGTISEKYPILTTRVDLSTAPISELTVMNPYHAYSHDIPVINSNQYIRSLKIISGYENLESTVGLWISISGCPNLTDLSLPNYISSFNISKCPLLGSQATSENPFFFNSTHLSGSYFPFGIMECESLKYLELGKNVTAFIDFFSLYLCPNLEVIYNSSPNVTEEDIAKCIVGSGSNHVLLFNNPGGTFTKGATFTSNTDEETNITTISNITMPTGTYTFTDSSGTEKTVDVAAWSHESGASWYHAGYEYGTLTPWGSNQNDYSYYYYCMNSFSTVTYKVYYADDSGTTQVDKQTQTVPCMYNTPLYDNETYPDSDVRKILPDMYSGGEWIYSTVYKFENPAYYIFGQWVTLTGDIDLTFYSKNLTDTYYNTYTFEWDYVNGTSVTKYSYSIKNDGDGIRLPTESVFQSNAKDSSGEEMSSAAKAAFTGLIYWIAPDGNAYTPSDTNKISPWGEFTLTAMLKPDSYTAVWYFPDSTELQKYRFIATGDFSVSPNFFICISSTSGNSIFSHWNTEGTDTGTVYHPGAVHNGSVDLYAIWETSPSTQIPYVTVRYWSDGSNCEKNTYVQGTSMSLRSDFVREGFKLIGWSYAFGDDSVASSSENVNFTLDTEFKPFYNLNLYAVWVEEPPTVITDNLLVSVDDVPTGDYPVSSVFIGSLLDGDNPKYTVTFYDSTGTNVVDKPTAIGVYVIKVGYQVFRDDDDVTDEYYSGYDGEHPVMYQCYNAFLTIYSGDHSTVID